VGKETGAQMGEKIPNERRILVLCSSFFTSERMTTQKAKLENHN